MDKNKIAAIVAFIFILPVFCLAGLFLLTGSVIKAFEKKPVIEATYRNKKKDGTFNKKESTISIAYPFCPFCGKKFSECK